MLCLTRRKSVSAAPVCSWCATGRWLLVSQSHTLQFGSGDQVPRDAGNSPCSRTEHLVKIFPLYKNDRDFFKAVACLLMKQS